MKWGEAGGMKFKSVHLNPWSAALMSQADAQGEKPSAKNERWDFLWISITHAASVLIVTIDKLELPCRTKKEMSSMLGCLITSQEGLNDLEAAMDLGHILFPTENPTTLLSALMQGWTVTISQSVWTPGVMKLRGVLVPMEKLLKWILYKNDPCGIIYKMQMHTFLKSVFSCLAKISYF